MSLLHNLNLETSFPAFAIAGDLLLPDPVIRWRIVADAALRQLMLESFAGLSASERAELQRLLRLPARRARR
jgi:hypothetical protein